MKREERLDFIARLIMKQEIKTQEELVERLLAHDIDVTQATISRDIKTLALIKVPAKTGGYRYDLPKDSSFEQTRLLHQELFSGAVTSVKIQDKMLSVRTLPGMTSLMKKYLLDEYEKTLFSVLTDDDSVLAIFDSSEAAKDVYDSLID